ncbi:MAG: hypothetical protein PHH84_00260 [Oscillospiraceae bacterium]|nr:hypothetical protein [Oscillospiraceae bacterium]MDD4413720.1 hypothetical protein [Oscillospiraceae bacterium]
MNKPAGVVSASRAPDNKTIINLIPDDFKRQGLFSAGRFDKNIAGKMKPELFKGTSLKDGTFCRPAELKDIEFMDNPTVEIDIFLKE